MIPGPAGSSNPSAVAQSPLRSTSVAAWPRGDPKPSRRRRPLSHCRPLQPSTESRGFTPDESIATNWGKPKAEPIEGPRRKPTRSLR